MRLIRFIDGETGENLNKVEVKKKEHLVKEQTKLKYGTRETLSKTSNETTGDITGNQEKTLIDNERIKYKSMIYETHSLLKVKDSSPKKDK